MLLLKTLRLNSKVVFASAKMHFDKHSEKSKMVGEGRNICYKNNEVI